MVVVVKLSMGYGGLPTEALTLRFSITCCCLSYGVCRLYSFFILSSSHVLEVTPLGKDNMATRVSRVVEITSLVASLDIITLFSEEYPWAHHATIFW